MSRQIIHVDMDAFFAAVEQRDDPTLRGKPVIVGGPSRRGVVATASYEARPFGVRSAMPMVEALRRCPQAIVVPGRHGRYARVSEQVFEIFGRFTPLVEGLSFDEAFLDVTHSRTLFGDGPTIARRIRALIAEELQLTASAGVAPCKFAAKIASDLHKPDGLTVVGEDVATFLAPLPLERMWGIGPVAAERVREAGYRTIGDLARADPRDLELLLGAWGRDVHQLAQGHDDRDVIPGHVPKSIGAEETFEHDVIGLEPLRRHLLHQATRIAGRLYQQGFHGDVVVLKIKLADFTLRTARSKLPEPVMDTDSIYRAALALWPRLQLEERPVRLCGIAVGSLGTGPVQGSLFDDRERRRRETVEALSQRVQERFGSGRLTRASLLAPTKNKPRRR